MFHSLKKGRIQNILEGVHLLACHYDTQVCSIIVKVYYDKHISVMVLIKAVLMRWKLFHTKEVGTTVRAVVHSVHVDWWSVREAAES